MKTFCRFVTVFACSAALFVSPAMADDKKPAEGAMPDQKAMMEAFAKMGALNENHKLLAGMVGDWDYTMKSWMDPSAPPEESKGTAKHVPMMDGRFIHSEYHGKMTMPGPDGKPTEMDFHGAGVTGYDNMSQKFQSVWMDSMSTGMMMSEGTYNPAEKTFTYAGEMCDMTNPTPGAKCKVRYTIKMVDNDKQLFEWFELRGGKEVKTMEITYTRKK